MFSNRSSKEQKFVFFSNRIIQKFVLFSNRSSKEQRAGTPLFQPEWHNMGGSVQEAAAATGRKRFCCCRTQRSWWGDTGGHWCPSSAQQ